MRNCGLPSLFEIKVPYVSVHQRDHQRRAQQDRGCADMISPGRMDTVNGNGRVECQHQAEKPKEQAKAHSRATL